MLTCNCKSDMRCSGYIILYSLWSYMHFMYTDYFGQFIHNNIFGTHTTAQRLSCIQTYYVYMYPQMLGAHIYWRESYERVVTLVFAHTVRKYLFFINNKANNRKCKAYNERKNYLTHAACVRVWRKSVVQ